MYLSSSDSERIYNLRCVLNFLVVVIHAWAAFQYIPEPQKIPFQWFFYQWLSNVFSMTLLPTLFFLSGFLFFLNHTGNWSVYKRKLRSRFKSLLTPYLLWNTLFVCVYLVFGMVFSRLSDRVESFGLHSISGILNAILGITRTPIDGPLWFVRNLFVMVCISPVIHFCVRRKKTGLLFLSLLFASIFVFSDAPPSVNPYCLFYFSMGGYLSLNGVNIFSCCERYFSVIALFFLVATFSSQYFFPGNMIVHYGLFALSIPFWMGISRHFVFKSDFLLNVVMPASFFIYAGHFLICSILLHLIAPRLGDFSMKLTVLYFLFVGVGSSLCVAVDYVLRRYLPPVSAIFSGGR